MKILLLSSHRHPDFVPEDLSVNDIESITEFIAEVVWLVDAFPEHEDDDSDEHEGLMCIEEVLWIVC